MDSKLIMLLILFQLKHFLADFPFQTKSMLKKFDRDYKVWIPALAMHSSVHAAGTFIISAGVGFYSTPTGLILLLSIFDFTVHFIVDRLKASPNIGGRWKIDQPKFWWCLGADQMVHHLTHYVIIYFLIQNI